MGITAILALAKDNWKVIGVAILLVCAVVYVTSLRLEIAHQETTIATLEADNTTLKQNNAVLSTALTTQNNAIDEISKLSSQTKKSFEALGVNVSNQTVALDIKLAAILKDKKPITCEETIKYLIDASKEYTK